jgi:hypothetical protein
MVVDRETVVSILERGDDRHDVVINGLREIALCGQVRIYLDVRTR